MPKPFSSPLRIFAAILLAALPTTAQPPMDSLNGKTVHLYVESDSFNAFYFQNGDIAFNKISKYEYSLTLSGRDIYQQDFFFTSNGNAPEGEHLKWKFGKAGLNATSEGRITVSEFQGRDTMWVIVDPAGPITSPPIIMLEAPKRINFLNPWPLTAPMLVWGGNKTRRMTTTPGPCGWFTTLVLDPAMVSGHFAEIKITDTYGSSGLGSTADYDFAALFTQFAAHGKSIWLNTNTNTWTPAWPGIDGICQYLLAATVRDFSKDHPDFDFGNITGDHLISGMVQTSIGADRKPVRSAKPGGSPISFDTFSDWWKTDTANANPKLRSYESCVDIPLTKGNDGFWDFDGYRDSPSDHSFYPIEGAQHNRHGDALPASCYVKPPPDTTAWVSNGPARNGNFCAESHAAFTYQPGQTFSIRGDDDIWVFINDKLVMDLGGVHIPKSDSLDLDKLALIPGTTYNWDFFICDRQPCASTLRMKTSIYFKQQRPLFGMEVPAPTPGSVSLEIRKRDGGLGNCTVGDSIASETKASNLTFLLLDQNGMVLDTLGNGTYHGGVTIANAVVTIDTSKLTTAELVPGATYRVMVFETSNPGIKTEIRFRVPGSTSSISRRKVNRIKGKSVGSRNVLGRTVPVFPNRVHSPATFQKASSPR